MATASWKLVETTVCISDGYCRLLVLFKCSAWTRATDKNGIFFISWDPYVRSAPWWEQNELRCYPQQLDSSSVSFIVSTIFSQFLLPIGYSVSSVLEPSGTSPQLLHRILRNLTSVSVPEPSRTWPRYLNWNLLHQNLTDLLEPHRGTCTGTFCAKNLLEPDLGICTGTFCTGTFQDLT